ncbi:hypothetical protein PO909_001079, partial [Leuciscus waleckii]
ASTSVQQSKQSPCSCLPLTQLAIKANHPQTGEGSAMGKDDERQLSFSTAAQFREHAVILDVRTRWNTLFLMVERFQEQFPAIQAASMDPRLKKSMEKDRLFRDSWWWDMKDTLPMLSRKACLSPEKADMQIFLKKNC